MKCAHSWQQSYKSYEQGKHTETTYFCPLCSEFRKGEGTYQEISTKKLDETDRRLDQTVREGKAHGKNINNLRSQMKNGKWQYKYIK